jgi:excisionase family DNA binding protein
LGSTSRPAAIPPRPYVSPAEYAALTGLSPATVRRYLKHGRIPYHQPAGSRGRILIPTDALELLTGAAASAVTGSAAAAQAGADGPADTPKLPGPRPKWTR